MLDSTGFNCSYEWQLLNWPADYKLEELHFDDSACRNDDVDVLACANVTCDVGFSSEPLSQHVVCTAVSSWSSPNATCEDVDECNGATLCDLLLPRSDDPRLVGGGNESASQFCWNLYGSGVCVSRPAAVLHNPEEKTYPHWEDPQGLAYAANHSQQALNCTGNEAVNVYWTLNISIPTSLSSSKCLRNMTPSLFLLSCFTNFLFPANHSTQVAVLAHPHG